MTAHRTDIEDNGARGEDAAWLPVCSCGWVGDVTHKYLRAAEQAAEHRAEGGNR